MTIMFETQDLEEASPATVSRVGMVFVEQSRLGWKPFLMSWIQFELGEKYDDEIRNHVRDLVLWIFPVMCDFALRNIDMPVPITKNELIRSLLKLMSILVRGPTREKCHLISLSKGLEYQLHVLLTCNEITLQT